MTTSLVRHLRWRLEFETRFNPAFVHNNGGNEEIAFPHEPNNLEKDRPHGGLFSLETDPIHRIDGSQSDDVQISHTPKTETVKLISINSVQSIKGVTPRPHATPSLFKDG